MDALDLTTRTIKALADENRIRMLSLLRQEELTVGELVQVLGMGQSRVSTHLALLKEAGLVLDRPDGRRAFYSAGRNGAGRPVVDGALERAAGSHRLKDDLAALALVLERRRAGEPAQDDAVAARFGSRDLPGRTWEGLARALLHLVPKKRTADLGVGEGDLTLLLAKASERLIAVDIDPQALVRLERKAERAGLANVETREGGIEDLPIAGGALDLVVLSQVLHCARDPGRALAEAHRVLARGGRVLVLDLLAHRESWVRERFGHRRLGFRAEHLGRLLGRAGFGRVVVERAARDRKPPHFVSLLATGVRS